MLLPPIARFRWHKAWCKGVTLVNAMTVAPSQQVMLKVRFLEASRSAERDLGVNWFGTNPVELEALARAWYAQHSASAIAAPYHLVAIPGQFLANTPTPHWRPTYRWHFGHTSCGKPFFPLAVQRRLAWYWPTWSIMEQAISM